MFSFKIKIFDTFIYTDYENTLSVTLPQMVEHAKSVVNASSSSCVVVDLPFGTYEESKEKAFSNSSDVMKETNCNAIKLEGGQNMHETVKFLTERSIPVMGHIGLQPQRVLIEGGYKVKGKSKFEWNKFIEDPLSCDPYYLSKYLAITNLCISEVPS